MVAHRVAHETKSKRFETQKWRIVIVAIFFFIIYIVSFGYMLNMQIFRHQAIAAAAKEDRLYEGEIASRRGEILVTDRNSTDYYPLAHQIPKYLIFIDPSHIENPQQTAIALAEALGLDQAEVLEKCTRTNQYAVLKHKASEEEKQAVDMLTLKAVYSSPEDDRSYPEGTSFSNVLGFVNNEGVGYYGLEKYYDPLLRGKIGWIKAEVDKKSRSIPLGDAEEQAPIDGADLYLTLDRSVQRLVEEKLKWGIERAAASEGTAIVMDPYTGAILAMASYPSYNPNEYLATICDQDGCHEDRYSIFNNSAISFPYEPGSVFKVITMSAALDSKVVKTTDTFHDNGQLVIAGLENPISNWDGLAHGYLSPSRCLELSSNVCLGQIAMKMTGPVFYEYIKRFGFCSQTQIDLAYEADGVIHDLEDWRDIQAATSGFGQGISVTPIQLITAVSAIANGGVAVQPHMVARYVQGDNEEVWQPDVFPQRIISQQTAEDVTQMMINVVDRAEGKPGKVEGYQIAGKTGTAQIAKPGGGGYEDNIFSASFIGYAPATAPKFIILIKMELTTSTPTALRWGSQASAPVFKEIAQELFKYYNIPPMGI
jgi:cell division protein FtsI/penicillin-binding protein 2